MQIKIEDEILIDKSDKYKYDLLNRKEEVENITKLIQTITDPFTLVIDGSWGTGKTSFVKLLEAELNEKNIRTSYFNAWERDYEREPFILILQKMIIALQGDDKLKNEIKDTAIKILKSLTINGSKALVSLVIPQGTTKALEDFATDVTSDTTQSIFESLDKEQENIEKLSNLLKELIEENRGKYVFIIDELDRCRPNFSIALLERLKHIFNTPNLIFVIATDLKQLANAVSGTYGEKFEGDKYLDKFIDFEYTLIEPNFDDYWRKLVSLVKGKPDIENMNLQSILEKYSIWLIKNLQLNARDIKRIFIHLYASLISQSKEDNSLLIISLVFIKYVDKDLFRALNQNLSDGKYLFSLFKLDYYLSNRAKFLSELDYEFIAFAIYLLAFVIDRYNNSKIIESFGVSQREAIKDFIKSVSDDVKDIDVFSSRIYFELYEKKNFSAKLIFTSEQFENALKIVNMQRAIDFKNYISLSSGITSSFGNATFISSS
ncbi:MULTISPECIES: KAP family P-loop NTPase fold protein [unclassified Moraxella]|uniref:KAP family P-loop NTPase fold protein n=1 Tax=unclassified Moraxella TaxID=2685852 RepID=UPI003AF606EB